MLKVNDKIAAVKDIYIYIYIFISVDILIMPSQGWGSDSKLGPMLNELIAKKWLS